MRRLQFMKRLRVPLISISIKSIMLLCLDFDGVLCDSLDECMLVAYNAYYLKNIEHPFALPLEFRQFFYRYRYLVGPVPEYCLLLDAYENRQSLPPLRNAARSDCLLNGQRYRNRFSEARHKLKQKLQHWLQLHQLYPQSQCVLTRSFPDFFIVTNKDSESVLQLARHHGYAKKILGVYGREISDDKAWLMRQLLRDHNISTTNTKIVFVDDNRANLHALKGLSIELRLAAWGYCDPEASDEFQVLHQLHGVIT